jgi:ATP-dependent Clp protease ATP-binding subunit ClpC
MFERFTERARQVVVLAQDEARMLHHGHIGTEHLLLGLLREEEGLAARALAILGVEIEQVRAEVIRSLGRGDQAPIGQMPFTPRAKQTLERSFQEAVALGHNYIGTEHLLLAVARSDGVAARLLADLDAHAEKLREMVHGLLSGEISVSEMTASQITTQHAHGLRTDRAGWEYQLSLLADADALTVEWLNELGAEGWELVSTFESSDGIRAIFKRRSHS